MSEREEKLDRDDEEDGAIKPILVSISKVYQSFNIDFM